ncbi:hypothetical protein VTI74DRAFT_638 [Chaetomium olivicolor]
MRARKEKPIFRGLTIAAVGDLGGSAQWTDTNIARWVGLREGKFVRDWELGKEAESAVEEGITHVVCSQEEFRRRESLVKAALKRPKTCQIVSLDWLEDSMLRRKRLDEEPYSHLKALKKERDRDRRRQMVLKGLERAEKEVNPNLYHLYRDYTFFPYEVVLTRDDEEAGVQGERYILAIYESSALPRLYWFVARYYRKKGDTQAKIYRPSYAPGVFAQEFALFESFFQIKTGMPWTERLIKAGIMDKPFFRYQPPTGGKPLGWVPKEFIPAEGDDVAATDGAVRTAAAPEEETTAAAGTEGNGREGTNATLTIKTFSDADIPDPQHQSPTLITPAATPRADRFVGVIIPSYDEDEEQGLPSPTKTNSPAFNLPTPAHMSTNVGFTAAN